MAHELGDRLVGGDRAYRSDAHGHIVRGGAHPVGELGAEVLERGLSGVGTGVGHDHRELVAAEPAEDVRSSQRRLQD